MSTAGSLMDAPATSTETTTRASEVIATVDRYEDAQTIVDTLSDRGFPVEQVSIVGSDLRLVESVTGRKRYGRAALEGAGAGAMTGLVIGVFLSLFAIWDPLVTWFGVIATWGLIGAVVGALLGMFQHALQRGRRDFSSVAEMRPMRFDVLVAAEHAPEARREAGLAPSPRAV